MNPSLDNMAGYYSTSNESQQRQIYSTMNTFLFAADLPEGTCEEDLYGFFQDIKYYHQK